MILVVNICKEPLHYYEFVKPIERILKGLNKPFCTIHAKELGDINLEKFSKIIICGTSLKDDHFLKDIHFFERLKDFKGLVFGICAGFQIIGELSGGKLKKKLEIGFFNETFSKNFLGLNGLVEVYHLHKNYIDFSNIPIEVFNEGKIVQAFKLDNFYGVLFHPEVRQKNLLESFLRL